MRNILSTVIPGTLYCYELFLRGFSELWSSIGSWHTILRRLVPHTIASFGALAFVSSFVSVAFLYCALLSGTALMRHMANMTDLKGIIHS